MVRWCGRTVTVIYGVPLLVMCFISYQLYHLRAVALLRHHQLTASTTRIQVPTTENAKGGMPPTGKAVSTQQTVATEPETNKSGSRMQTTVITGSVKPTTEQKGSNLPMGTNETTVRAAAASDQRGSNKTLAPNATSSAAKNTSSVATDTITLSKGTSLLSANKQFASKGATLVPQFTDTPKIRVVPPTNPTQKLLAQYGLPVSACKGNYKLANRPCRSYKDMMFMDTNQANRQVALASFPGSGNTWVRLLIEQATGIFTGSTYFDRSLQCTGFLAESIEGKHNKFIAIKTHEIIGKWNAAIFLLRNPYKAVESYYNYAKSANHTAIRKNLSGVPESFFNTAFDRWIAMCRAYIFNSRIPVHVVQYENLVENFKVELGNMVSFLNQTVSSEMLDCLAKEKTDQYQRKVHSEESLLSPKQTERIQQWIKKNEQTLKRFNISFKEWT